MTMDLGRKIDYDVFLEALLQKSLEGKVEWQETGPAGTFIAAIKGQQLFKTWLSDAGEAHVSVKDDKGDLLFVTPADCSHRAQEVYELARRIALRLDERVDKTLELLKQL